MAIRIVGVEKRVLPAFLPRLFAYTPRVHVEYGGAGSGKSYFVAQKLIFKACLSERKVLVVRKIGVTLRDSIWALFLDLLSEMRPVVRSINKTDMSISLVNGSQILFKGLDDREKIKSIHGIDDIVIEEATELNEEDFHQLNLRLRSPKEHNQIHLMFNPVSKANWVYSYFFIDPPEDALVSQSNYQDNLFLPPEYQTELERLKITSPAYYRIYALGEFATLDKLVFPVVQTRLVSSSELEGTVPWAGLDFGYVNDPSALTWGRYKTGKIYVCGEYGKTGLTNADLYKAIVDLGLEKAAIVADSAEPKSIQELRRFGLHRLRAARKGPDSIRHGIDFILRHELIVDERCLGLREELENYTWVKDKKTGEYLNQPIDAYNHYIDAMRYGLETVRQTAGEWVDVKL